MTERTTIMGMSASQARFLCLTARKNNVEFEGQQINQQRTSLSNESGSYYSQLCNMSVPTPPSIDDYTKVSYTFDDGALTNTVTSMIAKGGGKYSISYIQQWQDDYSIVAASTSVVTKADDGSYKVGNVTLRKLGSYDALTADNDPYLKTLTPEQREELMEQEKYYSDMMDEKLGVSGGEYYVRYVKDSQTGSYTPYFYRASDIEDNNNYIDGKLSGSLNCFTIGSTTRTKEVLNQEGFVEQDSTGRYLSITLFQNIKVIKKDEQGNILLDDDGNPVTETRTEEIKYNLVTNTTTDEEAYNDAMNKYSYEQHQYNQKVQEINSKIEIIQQQDKNLELKLKQLDTEQNAISQEQEAVKKVIKDNVEKSFKTFNA